MKTCCQFHQRLMRAFFIFGSKILNPKASFVVFGAKISYEKCTRKTLMKLTPGRRRGRCCPCRRLPPPSWNPATRRPQTRVCDCELHVHPRIGRSPLRWLPSGKKRIQSNSVIKNNLVQAKFVRINGFISSRNNIIVHLIPFLSFGSTLTFNKTNQ